MYLYHQKWDREAELVLSALVGGLTIAIYHEEFSCWYPDYFTKLTVEVKMNESRRTRRDWEVWRGIGNTVRYFKKRPIVCLALLKTTKEPNRKGLFFLAGASWLGADGCGGEAHANLRLCGRHAKNPREGPQSRRFSAGLIETEDRTAHWRRVRLLSLRMRRCCRIPNQDRGDDLVWPNVSSVEGRVGQDGRGPF
jgi:hypothetical protein